MYLNASLGGWEHLRIALWGTFGEHSRGTESSLVFALRSAEHPFLHMGIRQSVPWDTYLPSKESSWERCCVFLLTSMLFPLWSSMLCGVRWRKTQPPSHRILPLFGMNLFIFFHLFLIHYGIEVWVWHGTDSIRALNSTGSCSLNHTHVSNPFGHMVGKFPVQSRDRRYDTNLKIDIQWTSMLGFPCPSIHHFTNSMGLFVPLL